MTSEEKYNLIDHYLAGALKGEELAAFEQQLTTDKSLRLEVELHRQAMDTLKGEKVHQLRAVLKTVDQDWQDSDSKQTKGLKVLTLRHLAAIAASILLLFICYQLITLQSTSIDTLFADNYQPYPMVLNQRSSAVDSIIGPPLDQAIRAYQGQNFAEAAAAFKTLEEQQPENIAFRFYQALSELSSNNPDQAITILSELLESPDHLFAEQSRWYLALAYLQKGDREAATAQLQAILPGGYKYSEAQVLLRRVK